MDDGLTMWAIGCAISVGVFLNGVRFARMDKVPFKTINWFGRTVADPSEIKAKTNFIGRMFMIVAPLFAILWTLLAFGVLGPVDGMPALNPVSARAGPAAGLGRG
jgi:hypothetical protein